MGRHDRGRQRPLTPEIQLVALSDARDLARRAQIARRDAAMLVEHGLVHEAGDRIAVVAPYRDAATGEAAVFCPFATDGLLGDAAFARAVSGQWPDARELVVRVPPDAAPDAEGFAPLARYVRRPASSLAAVQAGADVRDVGPGTRGFVLELLAQAFAAGRRQLGRPPYEHASLVRSLGQRFTFDADGDARAVVAFVNGDAVGHATWLTTADEPLAGGPAAELVDVFVVDEHRGTGVSAALVAAAAARVEPGADMLGNVVCARDGHDARVIAKLEAAGWHRCWDHWWRPLV